MELTRPEIGDGIAMHEVATAAGGLDVNAPYTYVLWARDFADTTVVARDGGGVVAYCTGFRRPTDPDTLFVWQVAVAPSHRRRGLGHQMLDALVDRVSEVSAVEATVTADNAASLAMFGAFARRRGAELTVSPLFTSDDLGGAHEAEDLLRIGPLG
jgi:L-2,4-diaminobutyric acid acetyltransferase